jgi:Lysylphosphatidylglycerol synthase TM region/O-Antigen ligase
MTRFRSILTGVATAAAVALVAVSIDFGKLASSFHQLAAAPVVLSGILLLGNFVLAFLRFEWTLGALGVTMDRRTSAYAFALGNLAGQFLLNIIGQSLTRAVVLQSAGVPMSATVAATYLERLIALATVGLGAAASAVILFGSFGFELHDGGAYFLSVALAIALTLGLAGARGFTSALRPDELRNMLRTTGRLMPAIGVSLAAHLAMFGAYVVLVRAFMPDIDMAKLAPAIVIVMFAAGVPVSWAGWGLREFGAVYAFSAIGVPGEAAVVVAVLVGAASLLIALAAGAGVVVDAWLRPLSRAGAPAERGSVARALAPSDPLLLWTIGILTACLIYFQLRVPSGGGELTVNAADPLAITALFFAAVFARTDGFLRLFPRIVMQSVCALAGVLGIGLVVAWLGPGVSEWALLNRMLGFLFLLGYAAVPGLAVLIGGERGRAILGNTFVLAAVVICVVQVLAYLVHLYVTPLPLDFFGYLFAKGGQLEGYAQNPNAFAFQLLMAFCVLVGLRPAGLLRSTPPWGLVGAVVLLATLFVVRSRAGILCTLAAVVLAIALPRLPLKRLATRKALTIMLIAGAALVVLGLAFAGTIDQLVVEPFNRAWRPHADESDALRWQSTMLGLEAWLQHPVFGGGLGAFLLERAATGLPAVVIHSVPIWFLAEMGLLGLAGYAFFVVALLSCGLIALQRNESCARGLVIVIVVFVLMGLVHDVFFQRAFWFASGLMLVDPRRLARQEATTS